MNTTRSLLGLLAAATAHGVTYDFESLTLGPLTGQDGWVQDNGNALQVQQGVGFNTSRSLYSPASGTPNVAHHLSGGSFDFGDINGSEVGLILQADFRFDTNTSPGGGDFYLMFIHTGAAGPQIGYGPFGITLRDAGYGTSILANPPGLNDGDWVRLRLELDLTAFGGNGSASVTYQNLTDGDPGLAPIATMQNIDVNIAGAGTIPNNWDRLRIDGRSGTATTGGLDNLTVIVPEPSSALALLAGALIVAARRRR